MPTVKISAPCGLAAVLLLVACDIRFIAPRVSVLVGNEAISFAAGSESSLVGGETLLTIYNESDSERQIVLARLGDLDIAPHELLDTGRGLSDRRILDTTRVLAPAALDEAGERQVDSAHFHVFLAPGERHALFDRLGPTDMAIVLEFTPGEGAVVSAATAWR